MEDKGTTGVAIVEYRGEHVVGGPHKNNKTRDTPYVRTPVETMDDIKRKVKEMPSKDAYNKLIEKKDLLATPRDYRVVTNKKSNEAAKKRVRNGRVNCNSFADEFKTVLNMVQTNQFIRCVAVDNGRVSNIVVYTERQMQDIKSFCFRRVTGSVLACDKTFNLGAIYVTTTVFLHPVLRRPSVLQGQQPTPIFFGPMFLHGHSNTETYNHFFGHISDRLMDCDFHELTWGSDHEIAMRKFISQYFSRASTINCTSVVKRLPA